MIKPATLFLVDGLGALLSALLLGAVMPRLISFVGIPVSTLYLLAAFPVLFAIYDFYCFRGDGRKAGSQLRVIATLNLLYCILSVGLVIYHRDTVTIPGFVYFVLELLIVVSLALVEFSVSGRVRG